MPELSRSGRIVAGLLLAASVVAAGGSAGIVPAGSSIVATFRQENVPVDAPFRKFAGQIVYDAAHPEAASAALTVETASFDIGDPAYNAEVQKAAWFDSARYPQASFRSTGIAPHAPGHFDATGTLTIKGRALTVTVPITAQRNVRDQSFEGSFDISRKAFGIGAPTWDDVLDDKVHVRFHLVTPGS